MYRLLSNSTNMNEIETINNEEYKDDIRRIAKVLIDKGYNATLTGAKLLWQAYSDDMCAGWMILPEEDEAVFRCISGYLYLVY